MKGDKEIISMGFI